MEKFYFDKMPRVYFGEDILEESLIKEINNIGKNVLICYGMSSIIKNGIYDRVKNILLKYNKNIYDFNGIMSNPTYEKIKEGVIAVHKYNIDYIIAIGGGSVIDASKIISSQSVINEDIWDMEINFGINPDNGIKMCSIVTAFGTGSEMNTKGVITNTELDVKRSLIGTMNDFVILDPTLTLTVNNRQFISGVFDTFSHLMESYFGTPLNDNVSDDITISLMRSLVRNIKLYMINPEDIKVRGELMWLSSITMSGINTLGKVTDFQCHQIAHQLAAYTNIVHGEALAILHPKVYRHIYNNGVDKFNKFSIEVFDVDSNNNDVALLGIKALEEFIKFMGLPTKLSDVNIKDIDILDKVSKSTIIKDSCMKRLDSDEILNILKECL